MSDKNEEKGLTGLSNLGNTCFINSCMQILSHTKPLNEIINSDIIKTKINKTPESVLLLEWKNLHDLMWSENCTVNPNRWIQTIQTLSKVKDKDIFTGFAQNDLPEFLIFLFDSFHISLTRSVTMNINGVVENETDKLAKSCYEMMQKIYTNDYSEILKHFFGIHVNQIVSLDETQIKSCKPEPYFTIELCLPSNKRNLDIYDCFDNYCNYEKLEGDNAWLNEDTNSKENVLKNMVFWNFPDILILCLKRFNNNNTKDQRLVTAPLENLDLSKYVKGYNKESYVYDLYGICNHSGSTLGGHYTSYVKTENNNWYLFNDSNISKISEALHKKLISTQSYCLFYKKNNI